MTARYKNTMRFPVQNALLFLLLSLAATPALSAQEKRGNSNAPHPVTRTDHDRQQKPNQSRPLTLGESLAILGAALDSRYHSEFPSDCSHLVHELYERAGFPYEYASSSDLYAGIDEFRRVANPQPGDLAVWRGHAGIVINPAQRSFFSVLHSGPGVDSYDSSYWKQRGRPHFFRYVKAGPGGVVSTSTRTASLKPTSLGNRQRPEPDGENSASGGPKESLSETGSSAEPAENPPLHTEPSRAVVVNSVLPKPDQLRAAFLQACKDWEENLRERDLFKSAPSLVVFGHFDVKKVHIAENKGWAEVQIDQLVSLTESKAELHRRSERQRWPLSRRDNNSWELTPPPNTIYLPQHAAARILARELAQLTDDSPDTASRTKDKAELARVLDVLLEK